ncbi:MAG: hypothetical protein M3O50_01970 [Myxococcota bacterium]|nr:hypothetical protein [Myxococcota bacterium]
MMRARVQVVGGLAIMAALGGAGALSSCSQSATSVTVRTFQQAQKIDVVCMKVNDANGVALDSPIPTVEEECAQVAANTTGSSLPNHLYAVVTQTNRGLLAVVDLTAGVVIDEDRSTPGINFIPVGAIPTDVTVTPDGRFTFVSSASAGSSAIYGIPNARLLGDSTGLHPPDPLRLPDLLSCGLPQPAEALAVVPTTKAPVGGGASTTSYFVVAILRASGAQKARLVTIDASPFLQATSPDGGASGASTIQPGRLDPCPQLGAAVLSGTLPASWRPNRSWPDGVPYADAGDLAAQEPAPGPSPSCPAPVSTGSGASGDAGVASSVDGAPADAGTGSREAGDDDAAIPFALGVPVDAHPTSIALRKDVPFLYVADGALPLIHVFDLRDPANPAELQPLLATSVSETARRVPVGALAISPVTHDYKTYLYAVDAGKGQLMVFDITDPVALPQTPLLRPHAELNPLAPRDRLAFGAPVASVTFVRHDWPLAASTDTLHEYTGLLCNPNPNALDAMGNALDRGVSYRPNKASTIQSQGTVQNFPFRLRGVFAFATLSNGTIVTIDVDDWDAPCRRPDPMRRADPGLGESPDAVGLTGLLDLPQPAGDSTDLDPYHAPRTFAGTGAGAAVTLEPFFPVSAPHRPRSAFLLLNDPSGGLHVPTVLSTPQLFDFNGAPVAVSGVTGSRPLMLPTALPDGWVDPTYVTPTAEPDPSKRTATSVATQPTSGSDGGVALAPSAAVRLSFDDPTAHLDQDWTVTYEGALPTVSGIEASLSSSTSFQTLLLSSPGASFCARGIEDASIGRMRAMRAVEEVVKFAPTALASTVASLPDWTGDYVEITDDLLPSTDAYWSARGPVDAAPGDACWDFDPSLADDGPAPATGTRAQARYDTCQQAFGAPGSNPDLYLARDLPILNAYDDHLVVGRFGWNGPTESTANRSVVGADPSNVTPLKRVRCCFHHQAAFKVRAGGEWLTVGTTSVGLLHHVRADGAPDSSDGGRILTGGACVPSCESHDTLLNARTFDVPWADPANCASAGVPPAIDRNSPLAMRNPMFSFVMWAGCGALGPSGDHTLSTRDFVWKFQVRSGFTPLTVSLAQGTTTPVSPQSMRFINSLGQLAVVDGQAQGLVIIDLNTLTFAHSPYF